MDLSELALKSITLSCWSSRSWISSQRYNFWKFSGWKLSAADPLSPASSAHTLTHTRSQPYGCVNCSPELMLTSHRWPACRCFTQTWMAAEVGSGLPGCSSSYVQPAPAWPFPELWGRFYFHFLNNYYDFHLHSFVVVFFYASQPPSSTNEWHH